jgi:pimeloyl-ACP methyl ester carboxylesterase
LFGILAQPAQTSVEKAQTQTAILMLNVGTNHRVGPNRLYVKMARSWAARGYGVLRFDLAGIGDSRTAAGYSSDRLYSKGSTMDVQSAIDCLARHGYKRFVVMGLCSGAYVAFQTAMADARVSGQILMNPRRLEWKEGETLQSAMQISYKSTYYYKRALLDLSVYRRLLRNEIDVRGIAGRIGVLIHARIQRAVSRLLRNAPNEDDVLANIRQLSAKGTDTLMIIGAEDDGLDYIEFQLGSKGSRMRGDPHFKMAFVEGSDHTFSNSDSQNLVINIVQQHLDRVVLTNQK